MEYRQEDRVVYGSHGVCIILGIEEKLIDRKAVQYYVLSSVQQQGAKYYVPVHNALAVSKMRQPLTHREIAEMCADQTIPADCWIADEGRRKLRYRELMANDDPRTILYTVRLLRQHRQEQFAQGKKFHICDANFLKDAESLLANEIAYVLGIEKAEALNML